MKKLFTVLAVLLVATALFAQVGLTVKAGGAFGFANYKSVAEGKDQDGEAFKFEEILLDKVLILKTKGLGFDVSVQYDISDKLLAYVDFNMLFPKDMNGNIPNAGVEMASVFFPADVREKYFADGDLLKVYSAEGLFADMGEYIPEFKDHVTNTVKYSFFSVSAGAAYKLDFDAVKLAVGGGVTLNKASMKVTTTYDEAWGAYYDDTVSEFSFTSIGLNAMVDAKYMVTENIGVGLTLIPQLGLYNSASLSTKIGDDPAETITAKGFKLGFAMPIVVGVSYTF